MQPSWQTVGGRIASARKNTRVTLRKLHALTATHDPEGKGVLPVQINRIENGLASCDVRELQLLAAALNTTVAELLSAYTIPWFVVRHNAAEQGLAQVLDGSRTIERHDGAHTDMIARGVYHYMSLNTDSDIIDDADRAGSVVPQLMRKYLLRVGRCDAADMVLDSHAGEEIVYVRDGEMEFWAQQPGNGEATRKVTLCVGDCVQYPSSLRHGFRAAGKNDCAHAILVFTRQTLVTTSDIILTRPVIPPAS